MARTVGLPRSSLRRRERRSAALSIDQAQRAHVGPVLLDVLKAADPRVRVVRDAPAIRRGLGRRPQAVLTLVVHEYAVGSVWVFEGIRHGDPHFDRYASLPSPHSRR